MVRGNRLDAVLVAATSSLASCMLSDSPGEWRGSTSQSVSSEIAGITFQTVLGGEFLGAQNNGGSGVIAQATVAQAWETFTLYDLNGGTLESGDSVFIQAGNGQFWQAVDAGGSTLNAASNNELEWETFKVVKQSGGAIHSGDIVGLQDWGGTWVSAGCPAPSPPLDPRPSPASTSVRRSRTSTSARRTTAAAR
jgi:chitinase